MRTSRWVVAIPIIVFLMLLALPITLGFFYVSINQSLTNGVVAKQETITDLTASAVKIKLDSLVSLATSIASVDALSAQMAAGNWNGAATVASNLENNPAYYDPFIDRISIYDPQGIQQAAYPELTGAIGTRGASDAWYQPLVDGAPFYVDHVIQRLSTPRIKVFNIAVPVSRNGAKVGFLILQIPIANFLGFSVSDLSNPYIITYIVDPQGNLISDPNGSNPNGEPVSFSEVPAVQNVLAGRSGMMSNNSTVQIPSLVTYAPVAQYNWGVVTQVPTQAIFAQRDSILFLFAFGIVASILFDMLVTYLLWRLLLRKREVPRQGAEARSSKGFTLIELMVTIAIIAIIVVAVLLTINPAELLRQSRDANRISDLSVLKTAVSLYLEDSSNPNLASSTAGYGSCYISTIGSNATTTAKCGFFAGTYTADATSSQTNYRSVNSTGWLPINFSQLSYGSPFGALPIDPVNNASYYYAYAASSTGSTFEIDAFIESKKYGSGGTSDVVTTDGGDNNNAYEVGNKSGLNL